MLAESNDIDKIVGLATKAQETRLITSEAGHFLVKPPELEIVDLAQYQHAEAPARKYATVRLLDVGSFGRYVNRFKDPDTQIFGIPDKMAFVGVLDYHRPGEGEARHCKHRAELVLQTTDRWKTWLGANKKAMAQADFATFIADNLPDIYQPDTDREFPNAGDMLDIARELEAKNDVQFKSAVRLDNGQTQFSYVENMETRAGNGKIEVPQRFLLRMPIFRNQPDVLIECRLRYRISQGGLVMWFDMFRIDEVLNAEFLNAQGQVEELTGCSVLLGTPS